MNFDIFISHSSKNKNIADAVTAGLEARGLRCWIAPRDIVPGEDYAKQIVNAIKNTKAFVLIFSEEANRSNFVLKEVERAVSQGIPIIPFRIEDVMPTDSMELYISSAHWLDAFTMDMDNHIEKLSGVMSIILDKPLEKQIYRKSLTQTDVILKKFKKYLYHILLILFSFGALVGYIYLVNKSNIVIKSIKVDNRISINKIILKKLVTNSYYLKYRANINGNLNNSEENFDLRTIYYHQEIILPNKFKNRIEAEIKSFLLYLLNRKKMSKKKMNFFKTYDNIEISRLFYEKFIDKTLNLDMSTQRQREQLEYYFKNEILSINKLIEELKNLHIFKDRQLIKLKVINKNNTDKEISNTLSIKYKETKYKLYRINQPKEYENFMAVPVSNGYIDENSYNKKDYTVLIHSKINTLWFKFDKVERICSSGKENYLLSLFNRDGSIINGNILCSRKK